MSQRRQGMLMAIATSSVASFLVLAGCSPLPGRSLDPVYLKIGSRSDQPSVPPAQAKETPRPEATTARKSEWVGRYQDSRGAGDVTFSLVRGVTTVSGTWRLRTGGGGPVTAVAESTGRRLQLRLENTAPECPGTFEGWVELAETTLIGAYRGKDCEGPVSDGRLELRLR